MNIAQVIPAVRMSRGRRIKLVPDIQRVFIFMRSAEGFQPGVFRRTPLPDIRFHRVPDQVAQSFIQRAGLIIISADMVRGRNAMREFVRDDLQRLSRSVIDAETENVETILEFSVAGVAAVFAGKIELQQAGVPLSVRSPPTVFGIIVIYLNKSVICQ